MQIWQVEQSALMPSYLDNIHPSCIDSPAQDKAGLCLLSCWPEEQGAAGSNAGNSVNRPFSVSQ